jgi:PAS domain S-box-containing protein
VQLKYQALKLRWRFVLLITLTIIPISSFFVILNIRQQTDELHSDLIKSASDIGSFVALTSQEPLLNYDYFTLNNLMKQISLRENVIYSVILRNNNPITTYINHENKLIKPLLYSKDKKLQIRGILPQLRLMENMKILTFHVNINEINIAQIELGVSLNRLDQLRYNIMINGLLEMLALFVSLALLIAFEFHQYVIRPLQLILDGIENNFINKTLLPVKVVREDELGQLAAAFNKMMLDIRRSHHQLKDREQNLSALTNSVNEGIIRLDNKGDIIFWNHSAEVMFGYSSEHVKGKNIHQLLTPAADREQADRAYAEFAKEGTGILVGQTTEVQAMCANGKQLPCELTISALPTAQGWHAVGVVRDISARLKLEQEQRLAATAFETHDAIIITDKSSKILRVNQAFLNLTGYQFKEVVGKTPRILQSGRHSREFYQKMWKKLLSDGLWRGELWNRRKNGEIYPQWLNISAVKDAENNITHFVGVSSDLSVSYAQKNRISLLLNSTAEGIVGTDNKGLISFVNQSAQKVLGHQEKLIGNKLCQYLGMNSSCEELLQFEQMASGKIIHENDSVLIRANKQPLAIEYWLRPMFDNSQYVGAILTFIDITVRKQAEDKLQHTLLTLEDQVERRTEQLHSKVHELERTREELIHSEKMASLGRLVAGFAHEINTPIGIAVGGSSQIEEITKKLNKLFTQDEVDVDVLIDYINTIQDSAALTLHSLQRTAKLVTSFKRTAVDKSNTEWYAFILYDVIQNVIASLHNIFKRSPIKIQLNCPKALKIYSQPGLIEQIMTNLLLNSHKHGFNDGQDQGEIIIDIGIQNNILNIDYSDSGKGMDKEHQEKIFEPFYTTARHQGGSGLGMFICYNLVTGDLHGNISCNCPPGKGCLFHISIPLSKQTD